VHFVHNKDNPSLTHNNFLANCHLYAVVLDGNTAGTVVPPIETTVSYQPPPSWAVVPALGPNGVIQANGSAPITAAPPPAASNLGWKSVLYDQAYAVGISNFTLAVMSGQWLSLFDDATPPANNASAAVPDANAKVSLGTDGSGVFTGPVTLRGN